MKLPQVFQKKVAPRLFAQYDDHDVRYKKGVVYFFYVALGIYAFVLAYLFAGDAKVYYTAAEYLIEGKNIYGSLEGYSQRGDWETYAAYLYSPLFAVTAVPFTVLPKTLSFLIWYSLNFYWVWLTLRKLLLFFPGFSAKDRVIVQALSLLLVSRFMKANLELGQLSFLMLFLSVEGLSQIFIHNKKVYGAALLALAINFKLLPLVFIFYLLYRNQFKAFGWLCFFSLLYLVLPALFLGWQKNWQMHELWATAINPFKDFYAVEKKAGLFNISAFVPALFSEIPYQDRPVSYNLFNLNEPALKNIILGMRLFFIGLTLFFLRSLPFRKEENNKKLLWEWSYLFIAIVLIFPRQSKYAYYFLLPSVFYLVGYGRILLEKRKLVYRALIAYFIVSHLTSIDILIMFGREVYDASQFLKVITFATFILIAALMASPPWKYNRRSELPAV